MANTKSKTQVPRKLITKRRVFLLIGFVILIIVAVIGVKVYQHRQAQNKQFKVDQANFKQAETQMAQAYAAVVQQVGQPYETKLNKTCAYANLKFRHGPLSCGINRIFSFEELTSTSAAERSVKVKAALEASEKLILVPGSFSYADDGRNYEINIDGIKGLTCELKYDLTSNELYRAQIATGNTFNKKSAATLISEYSLNCGAGATKPLYQLENN